MTDALTKKEQTHARILDAASKSFKIHGFAGVGVDGIAKTAGVTSGAFYAHFGSKDAAFSQILASNFQKTLITIPTFQREHGENWINAFTTFYLSKEHREDIACGCWMTALTPEITKASSKIQEQYEKQMNDVISVIALGLSGGTAQDRKGRAWAFLSTLIGGLNMARAMSDETTIKQITDFVHDVALKAATER
jgi:TetR/AcrR family transcriptional regulator, transcriptional repressor for nem operon